jgi:hypothetical protein
MTIRDEYIELIKDVAGMVWEFNRRYKTYLQQYQEEKGEDKRNKKQWMREALLQKRVALETLRSITHTYRRIQWKQYQR